MDCDVEVLNVLYIVIDVVNNMNTSISGCDLVPVAVILIGAEGPFKNFDYHLIEASLSPKYLIPKFKKLYLPK